MIGTLSYFYGWSYQECLKLPIRAFFAFYDQALKMEAAHYRELLDISAVPAQELSYYKTLRERYNAVINPKTLELPPKPPGPVLNAGSPETKRVMMNLFGNLKRSMGYGG